MIAGDFTVVAVTLPAEGGTQLRLQPVGEPGFRIIDLLEPVEEGTLGDIVVELVEGQKYLPRPGQGVRLKITKAPAE